MEQLTILCRSLPYYVQTYHIMYKLSILYASFPYNVQAYHSMYNLTIVCTSLPYYVETYHFTEQLIILWCNLTFYRVAYHLWRNLPFCEVAYWFLQLLIVGLPTSSCIYLPVHEIIYLFMRLLTSSWAYLQFHVITNSLCYSTIQQPTLTPRTLGFCQVHAILQQLAGFNSIKYYKYTYICIFI